MLLGEVLEGQIIIMNEPGRGMVIYRVESKDGETLTVKEVIITDGEMEVTEIESIFHESCFDMEVSLYQSIEVKI